MCLAILALTSGLTVAVASDGSEILSAHVPEPRHGDRFTYEQNDTVSHVVAAEVPTVVADGSTVPGLRFERTWSAGDAAQLGSAFTVTDHGIVYEQWSAENETYESEPDITGQTHTMEGHSGGQWIVFDWQYIPCGWYHGLQGHTLVAGQQITGRGTCGGRSDFHVVSVERDGDAVVAAVDEYQNGTLLWTLIVADGVPYVLRAEGGDGSPGTMKAHLQAFERGGFDPGIVVSEPGIDWEGIDVPWGIDDTGIDHPWPPSRAWAQLLADPRAADLAAFLDEHPDAYPASGRHWYVSTADYDSQTWEWVVSDGDEAFSGSISQQVRKLTAGGQSVIFPEPVTTSVQVGPNDEEWPGPDQVQAMPRWKELLAAVVAVHGDPDRSMVPTIAWSAHCFSDCDDADVFFRTGYASQESSFGVEMAATQTPYEFTQGARMVEGFTSGRLQSARSHDWSQASTDDPKSGAADPPIGLQANVVQPATPEAQVAAVAVGAGGLLIAAIYLFLPLLKQLPLFGLFSRIGRHKVLDNPLRQQLYDLVNEEPGIHFQALARALGKGQGTARHHLERLESAGLVRCRRGAGFACYFPRSASRTDMAAAPVVKSDVARRLLEAARERPGVTASEIAAEMGVTAATASYHVKRLMDAGLLHGERHGNRVRLSAVPAG